MISAAPAPRAAGGTCKCAGVEDRAESPSIFKSDLAAGFGRKSRLVAAVSRAIVMRFNYRNAARMPLSYAQAPPLRSPDSAPKRIAPSILPQVQGARQPGAANP